MSKLLHRACCVLSDRSWDFACAPRVSPDNPLIRTRKRRVSLVIPVILLFQRFLAERIIVYKKLADTAPLLCSPFVLVSKASPNPVERFFLAPKR